MGASTKNFGELANLEFASTQMRAGGAVAIWSDDKFFGSLQNHKNGLTAPELRVTTADLLKGARDAGSLSEQDFRSIVTSYRENVDPFRTQTNGLPKSIRLDTFDTPSVGTGNVLADRGALSRALATGEVTPRGAAAFLQSAGLPRAAADFLAFTRNGAPLLVTGVAAYALYKIVNDVAEAKGVSPSTVLADAAAGLSYDDLRSAAAGVITEGLIQSALGPLGVARQLYGLALAGDDIVGAIELLELAHPNDSVVRSLGDMARAFKETAAYQVYKDNNDALQRAVSDWLAGDGERYADDYSRAINGRVATGAALTAISGNLSVSSRTLAGFEIAADGTRLDKAWVQLQNGTRILEYDDGGAVVRRDYWAGSQKVLSEYASSAGTVLNYFDPNTRRLSYAATIVDGSDVAMTRVDLFGRVTVDVPSLADLRTHWAAIDQGPFSLFPEARTFDEADFAAALADPRVGGLDLANADGLQLTLDQDGRVGWVRAEVRDWNQTAPGETVTVEREIAEDPFAGTFADPSAYAYKETVTLSNGTVVARTERTPSGTTIVSTRIHASSAWTTTVTRAPAAARREMSDDEAADVIARAEAYERQQKYTFAGATIGSALGSSIGNAIGGSNTFARIGASTVLGVTLGNIGGALGNYIADTSGQITLDGAVLDAFRGFDAQVGQAFGNAAVGAVSSFLTGELAQALGFDGQSFGDQLLRTVGGNLTNAVLQNVANGADLFAGIGGQAFNAGLGASVGSFLGNYLARQIVQPTNQAGAIGGSIGSALGTAMSLVAVGAVSAAITAISTLVWSVVLPVIGAFIGTVLGTVIGRLFGPEDDGMGVASLAFTAGSSQMSASGYRSGNWNVGNISFDLRNATQNILGQLVAQVGGVAKNNVSIQFYRDLNIEWKEKWGVPYKKYVAINNFWADVGSERNTTRDTNALVAWVVIKAMKQHGFEGGDRFATQAVADSTASDLGTFSRQIAVAKGVSDSVTTFVQLIGGTLTGILIPNFNVALADDAAVRAAVPGLALQALKSAVISGGNAWMKEALARSNAATLDEFELQVRAAAEYGRFVDGTASTDLLPSLVALIDGSVTLTRRPDFNIAMGSGAAAMAAVARELIASLKSATYTSGDRWAVSEILRSTATALDVFVYRAAAAKETGRLVDAFVAATGGTLREQLVANAFSLTRRDDVEAAVDAEVLRLIKSAEIFGGDVYTKRALALSRATTVKGLTGDVLIAQDYATYLKDKATIDALIAQDPTSAFSAGWVLSLLKADELGLDATSAADFNGGLAQYLKSYGLQRLGGGFADIAVSLVGTTLVVSIGAGTAARTIEIPNFVSLASATLPQSLVSDGSTVTGTTGTDLWFGTGGTSFVDGALANASTLASSTSSTTAYLLNNDVVAGDNDAESLDGGTGDDLILGNGGNDTLGGGQGNDVLVGGRGADVIMGGRGNDLFAFGRGDGRDTVSDDGGVDALQFGKAVTANDLVVRLDGSDLLVGLRPKIAQNVPAQNIDIASLTDLVRLTNWLDPAARIESFSFADGSALDVIGILDLLPVDRALTVTAGSLTWRAEIDTSGATDCAWQTTVTDDKGSTVRRRTLKDSGAFETAVRRSDGVYDLTAAGTAATEALTGGSGNDVLIGSDGNDKLLADDGNDTVYGGAGNDTLVGGGGYDVLVGGDGDDAIYDDGINSIDGGGGYDVFHNASAAFRGFDMASANIEQMIATENGNTVTTVRNSDGTMVETASDTANSQSYAWYANHYNPSYQLYLQQFREDNGQQRIVGYDVAGSELYQHYQNTYDAQDRLLTQYILDDNGQSRFIFYDVTNSLPFQYYQNTYDAQHRILLQQIRDDNGQERIVGYDLSATQPFQFYVNTFDTKGLLIQQRILDDNGSSRVLVPDIDNPDVVVSFGALSVAAQINMSNVGSGGLAHDEFDCLEYLASHGDLISAYGADSAAAARHYVEHGFAEGRARDTFDNFEYLASHADLIAAFGGNTAAAARHYVEHGFAEGRARDSFDNFEYLASHADLIAAFGGNTAAAARHYVEHGFAEGRARDSFDNLAYLASYDDLVLSFGGDGKMAAEHYVRYGAVEGRSIRFDGARYLANYPDLAVAFGNDVQKAAEHYITYGLAEGRTWFAEGRLTGTTGADYLIGDAGANVVLGLAGADVLNGSRGNDTLIGGGGDDTYVLDSTGDVITEAAGEGTDTVQASVSVTLADNVENLTLTGTRAIEGTGNTLNNVLTGNSAANILDGGAGNDTLVGGAGSDRLKGGSGSDLYLVGTGTTTIDNTGGDAATTDEVRLTLANAAADVWLGKAGSDLMLSLGADRTVVAGWYAQPASQRVDAFRLASGQRLQASDVDALVNAMAQFSTANGVPVGQRPTVPLSSSLQIAISSAWAA